jgi:hypothetical protein
LAAWLKRRASRAPERIVLAAVVMLAIGLSDATAQEK